MWHFLAHWLGIDNAGGRIYLSWSGFIGSSIFGAIGAILRRTLRLHHAEQLAQAALHHKQLMEQAQAHHDEHMAAISTPAAGS